LAWIRHQLYLLGLYILGAAIPLGGVLLLLAAGLLMFGSITGLVLGAFLLSNGIYGLVMSFKSFPLPVGRTLNAENTPGLVEKLDELALAWKGPRTRELILDPGFWTLDLVGVPTLGLLGWPRFKWLLGIYPMLALGGREFEAIASWELVWWCDQQGWLNLQVKRLAAYWMRLDAGFQRDGSSRSPLKERWSRAFLKPYARWVNRRFEHFLVSELVHTDAIIARQYGAATLVRALCRLALLKPLLDCRVFSEWDRFVKQGESLPLHPYAFIREHLGRWPEGAEALLELSLDGLVPEAPPLLRLRLEHLEESPALPLPAAGQSPAKWLEEGGVFGELEAQWSGRLQKLVEEAAHSRVAKDTRFLDLRPILASGFPRHFDSKEYLQLAATRLPAEAFLPLAGQYLQVHPSDTDIRLLLIKVRLRQGDGEARKELDGMVAVNPFLGAARHELLGELAREQGDASLGEIHWVQARRSEVEVERAREERRQAGLKHEFEAHGCSAGQVEEILAVLRQDPRVREAYLVRKHVEHFPEHPVLLLIIRWRRPLWDLRDRKRSLFQTELAVLCPFPAHHSGFVLVTTRGPLRRKRARLRELDARIL